MESYRTNKKTLMMTKLNKMLKKINLYLYINFTFSVNT
jgi:hypothetical protein